jgi:AcrR family transcriptional regulator
MSSRAKPSRKRRRVQRPKRRHVPRPDIRATLLDAAEALFREEGYAAATVRRIASRVGMKHQVVFYYFDSHDDLLLALFRRKAESYRERLSAALNSNHPLRSMWDLISDPDATKFGLEFMALANHNDAVRAEIASNAATVRALEAEAVARYLKDRGIRPRLSPQLVSILTNALARLLVQEATLGIHTGHEEAEALVDNSLRNFEASGETDSGVEAVVDAMSSSDRSVYPR